VPGGVVGVDIAGLIGTSAITPLVLLASLLAAAVLGAGHALTPGHGKTLMGAYLVGSRGTPLHAIALGLSVTVSHTLGIVVLAAIILQARDIAPELFNTVAPVVSGMTVIAIGGWLLLGQVAPIARTGTGRWTATGPTTAAVLTTATLTSMGRATSTGTATAASAMTTWPRRMRRSGGGACSSWAWPVDSSRQPTR
jgi:ABC-type nickel/cobalt efflux system permease component RcnA